MDHPEADGRAAEHGSPAGADPIEEDSVAVSAGAAPSPAPAAPFLPRHWQASTPSPGAGPDARPPQPSDPVPAAGSATSVVPVWGPITPSAAVPTGGEPARGPAPGWRWAAVSLVAALFGALIGGGIVAAATHDPSSTTVKEISAGPALLNGTTDIESVIAKVLPAVVSIDATGPVPASESPFGGGASAGQQEDEGTGMIITASGEVVTNNHVIAGATTITVTLFGSVKALPATLIDTDPSNDMALLQINGQSNLPTVSYGNSDDVQVGDAVVAIGNALGLQAGSPTVTQGIISATGRTVQATDSTGQTTETLSNMFQTDAAINPGNSGGPLVDSSGKVIGMNTAVAANENDTAQAENIGFAIPANRIQLDLPKLREKSIGSGYLGVQVETLTGQLRSAYNFVPTQGAVVLQVESGSPADIAGLEEGDVITSLEGTAITSAEQLGSAIQADKPDQHVTIGLYRGQTQMTVTAVLGSTAQEQQPSGG